VFWVPAEPAGASCRPCQTGPIGQARGREPWWRIEARQPRLRGGGLPKITAELASTSSAWGTDRCDRQRSNLYRRQRRRGLVCRRAIAPWILLGGCRNLPSPPFAPSRGQERRQFYTPSCVWRCWWEDAGAHKGRIYDPLLRLGGIVRGRARSCGKPRRPAGTTFHLRPGEQRTTRRLAVMNLATARHRGRLPPEHADSFRRDINPNPCGPDLRDRPIRLQRLPTGFRKDERRCAWQ